MRQTNTHNVLTMMTAVEIKNRAVYFNLLQSYEGEFSRLTGKKPGADGLFQPDTLLEGSHQGWLIYSSGYPAGLAAIDCQPDHHYEMKEFYIVPVFRRNGLGREFAHQLFQAFPGHWTIKQITGADYAVEFWRSAINSYVVNNFCEDHYTDPYWGDVTRHRFSC